MQIQTNLPREFVIILQGILSLLGGGGVPGRPAAAHKRQLQRVGAEAEMVNAEAPEDLDPRMGSEGGGA